jgi:hypothetical protein
MPLAKSIAMAIEARIKIALLMTSILPLYHSVPVGYKPKAYHRLYPAP